METERPTLETTDAAPQVGQNHEAQLSPSPSPQPNASNRRRARPRLGSLIAVVAALILGLAGGVLFHQRIGSFVGLSDHSHRAGADGKKQLWTCSMHPQVL